MILGEVRETQVIEKMQGSVMFTRKRLAEWVGGGEIMCSKMAVTAYPRLLKRNKGSGPNCLTQKLLHQIYL